MQAGNRADRDDRPRPQPAPHRPRTDRVPWRREDPVPSDQLQM